MPRNDLRIVSLFVVLAACNGEVIDNPTLGSTSETGETTSDDDTTKPPTTDPTTTDVPTDPSTEPPATTGTSTTDTTADDTTTDVSTTGGTTIDDSTTDGTTTGTTTDGTTTDGTTTDGTTDGTTTEPLLCGNAALDDGEACDGDLNNGQTCMTEGFDDGLIACAADCTLDTSGCIMFSCGNNAIDGNEICDGTALGGADCISEGFSGGALACADNCGAFDTSGCFSCGNDMVDGNDVCDGIDLAGQDCVSQGFDGGALACLGDCSAFDSAGCFECGDDTINGSEVCDGPDLANATCMSEGFIGGTLACQADCSALDTSMCTSCGDNTIDMNETCDGTDLAGETCVSQGFIDGTLACVADCSDFDTVGCSNCGNNTIDPPEACDGTQLGTVACAAQGLEYGYACCGSACAGDLSNCADQLLESEPNDDGTPNTGTNDFSTVNADGPITSNTVVVGALMPAGDDDIYAITNPGPNPAILIAETYGPGGPGTCPFNDIAFDTFLEIRSAANAVLASDDDGGGGYCSRIANFVVAPNTTVYARVIDLDDNLALASYHLGIDLRQVVCGDGSLAPSEQCDDGNTAANDGCSATCTLDALVSEVEPNTTNAQADLGPISTGNSLYTGAIAVNADVDRYRVDVAAPTFHRLETFSKGYDCAGITTNLRLFNAANAQLALDVDASGIQSCAALVFQLPAGQSYVQVEETGNNATIPVYQLDIKPITDLGVESEPNDNQAAADTNIADGSDVLVLGAHPTAMDSDFYAITVPTCGSSLRVEIVEGGGETCESNEIDSLLSVYDSNGNLLEQDDDAGRGFCSRLDGTGTVPQHGGLHDLSPGTYFVQVQSSNLANATQAVFDYRLVATLRKP